MSKRQTLTIPHEAGSIKVVRDALGYPQIQAKDHRQSAYARGYMHALDRLIQVELNRLAMEGRLMEVLGDQPFARLLDRCVRAFDLSANLDEEWGRLRDETKATIESYCAGFAAGAKARGWPWVLRLLKLPKRPYTPKDTLRMYRFSCYMALSSIQHLAEAMMTEMLAEGAKDDLIEILLGDSAAGLEREDLRDLKVMAMDKLLMPLSLGGSNAFAVSPERSESGHALLMGEFHMEIGQLPPLLYTLHIETAEDGDFYQGMGIPGLPWLSAGRNASVGWSYTNAHADDIDMLVERCEGGRYLAAGEWKPFLRRREELVKIKGRKEAERWVFYENEYGTLLGDPEVKGDYPCLRWSGMRDGTANDTEIILWMSRCKSTEEALRMHEEAKLISVWTVVADKKGEIGLIKAGSIDQRPAGWTGAYPRKAWDLPTREVAPLPKASLPRIIAPAEGVIASANERRDAADGTRWINLPEPHYRLERLEEILASRPKHDLRSLMAASYDEVDLCAKKLMAIWSPLLPEEERVKRLAAWAAKQEPLTEKAHHREQMALFHALHRCVLREILAEGLGEEAADHLFSQDGVFTLCFQYHIDQALGLEKPHLVDATRLRLWLAKAWPQAKALIDGGDFSLPPRFAFLNRITQDALPVWTGWSTRKLEIPGGPTAPFQSRVMKLRGHPMLGGPAFHLVMDMSQRGSWYNTAGGASERRFGAGYGAGIDEWLRGELHPLGHPEGKPPNLPS